ncbi:uncharacterized protein LAESUDRAFT_750188 [Laetiporus sulphureus 93-53]|uniref:F-box domain-containing protein n=1 Tax=Laetiporus sulphureus 93-53 TaxID=1314785 RepID=A0A165E187_9APHY|nr:uncharacterized protein LAESUDRAFT_750188 [Laetiporus sulphureus 93-53]KZT06055.1 hypothetical protein LAESUDRAFT_750188 [Laetiporus sulphureus 93-53]
MDSGPADLGGHATSNDLGHDAEEHIAREIAMHHREIQKLRKRLNSHRTACRLPVEILTNIFEEVRLTTQTLDYSPLQDPDPYEWIVVTHVCSLWRDVALRSPALWRHIYVTETAMEWITEILSRSKDIPLVVVARYVPDSAIPRQMVAVVLQKMFRIGILRISAPMDVLKNIAQLIDGSAPVLQHIIITCNSTWHEPVSFGLLLNPEQLPVLQRLELDDISFPWGTPLPHTVRELTSRVRETTLGDMLRTLNTVPGLEVLSLSSNPFSLSDNREDHTIVPLPRLRLLCFSEGDISHVASLVDHISFPLQTSIEWTCPYAFGDEQPFATLAAKLFTRTQWKALHISSELWRIMIRASSDAEQLDWCRGYVGSSSTLDFSYASDLQSLPARELVATFCKAVPLIYVRTLEMSCGFDDLGWMELFGDLPNLSSLHVVGGMALTLPRALRTRLRDDGDGDVLYFAHDLRTLTFSEVDFMAPAISFGPITSCGPLKELEIALQERRAHDVNLKKIAFRHCTKLGDYNRRRWEHLAEKVEHYCSWEEFTDTDEGGYLSEADIPQIDEDDEDFDDFDENNHIHGAY